MLGIVPGLFSIRNKTDNDSIVCGLSYPQVVLMCKVLTLEKLFHFMSYYSVLLLIVHMSYVLENSAISTPKPIGRQIICWCRARGSEAAVY